MNIKPSRFDFNCLTTPSDNFKRKKKLAGDKIATLCVCGLSKKKKKKAEFARKWEINLHRFSINKSKKINQDRRETFYNPI